MFGKHFELNEDTLAIVKDIGSHMPGGFFIYRAGGDEELLYVEKIREKRGELIQLSDV